jgi:hypothetical protein
VNSHGSYFQNEIEKNSGVRTLAKGSSFGSQNLDTKRMQKIRNKKWRKNQNIYVQINLNHRKNLGPESKVLL